MRHIDIQEVTLQPSIVTTGQKFLISIQISEIIPAIITSSGSYLATSNGLCLEVCESKNGG